MPPFYHWHYIMKNLLIFSSIIIFIGSLQAAEEVALKQKSPFSKINRSPRFKLRKDESHPGASFITRNQTAKKTRSWRSKTPKESQPNTFPEHEPTWRQKNVLQLESGIALTKDEALELLPDDIDRVSTNSSSSSSPTSPKELMRKMREVHKLASECELDEATFTDEYVKTQVEASHRQTTSNPLAKPYLLTQLRRTDNFHPHAPTERLTKNSKFALGTRGKVQDHRSSTDSLFTVESVESDSSSSDVTILPTPKEKLYTDSTTSLQSSIEDDNLSDSAEIDTSYSSSGRSIKTVIPAQKSVQSSHLKKTSPRTTSRASLLTTPYRVFLPLPPGYNNSHIKSAILDEESESTLYEFGYSEEIPREDEKLYCSEDRYELLTKLGANEESCGHFIEDNAFTAEERYQQAELIQQYVQFMVLSSLELLGIEETLVEKFISTFFYDTATYEQSIQCEQRDYWKEFARFRLQKLLPKQEDEQIESFITEKILYSDVPQLITFFQLKNEELIQEFMQYKTDKQQRKAQEEAQRAYDCITLFKDDPEDSLSVQAALYIFKDRETIERFIRLEHEEFFKEFIRFKEDEKIKKRALEEAPMAFKFISILQHGTEESKKRMTQELLQDENGHAALQNAWAFLKTKTAVDMTFNGEDSTEEH